MVFIRGAVPVGRSASRLGTPVLESGIVGAARWSGCRELWFTKISARQGSELRFRPLEGMAMPLGQIWPGDEHESQAVNKCSPPRVQL